MISWAVRITYSPPNQSAPSPSPAPRPPATTPPPSAHRCASPAVGRPSVPVPSPAGDDRTTSADTHRPQRMVGCAGCTRPGRFFSTRSLRLSPGAGSSAATPPGTVRAASRTRVQLSARTGKPTTSPPSAISISARRACSERTTGTARNRPASARGGRFGRHRWGSRAALSTEGFGPRNFPASPGRTPSLPAAASEWRPWVRDANRAKHFRRRTRRNAAHRGFQPPERKAKTPCRRA